MTPLRRATTAVATLALAAGGLAALGTAPAHAAPTEITGASLTWGFNGYAQKGIFGPWRIFDTAGDAAVLSGSVSGGDQSVYAVEPVPATSMPASSPQKTPNVVQLTNGTGTADPETGMAELSWTGTYTLNAYPEMYNAPDEIYSDPALSIDAAGVGTLTMEVVIGEGVDMDGNPTPAVDLGRLPVATFSAGSADATSADSSRLTADYQGVAVEGVGQVECTASGGATGWWGSWPEEFVTAMPESVRPHFVSTGCGGMNDNKPPLPVDLDLGLVDQVEADLTATAPARKYGQSATVSVQVASAGSTAGSVVLSRAGAASKTADVADGVASFSLGKLGVGTYTYSAQFSGNDETSAATVPVTVRVTKATSTTVVNVNIKPTTKKAGKAVAAVSSPTTTPGGKVRVVVKKGSKVVKNQTVALKSRKAVIGLPKGAKGAYKVTVSYLGNANVATSQKTASYTVR